MSRVQRVFLLSIDGLRADFYRQEKFGARVLKRAANHGFSVDRALPVYPTVTLTNHVTLVTGVSSSAHGVYGNTRFKTIDGEFHDVYTHASDIRAETLWDSARRSGLRVALLHWPATREARAHIVVPEPIERGPMSSYDELDERITAICVDILRAAQTQLVLAHLVVMDHAQHEFGRDSPEVLLALSRTDRRLERILHAVDLSRTRMVIVGDHGFTDFNKRFCVNALLQRYGYIDVKDGKISSWRALAHINCAQAAIYVHDPKDAPKIIELLRAHAGSRYTVLDRARLDELRAFPDAICAIDCLPGYGLHESLFGDLEFPLAATRSDHGNGFEPWHANQGAGFIALGTGVAPGRKAKEIRLLDVAPTVASWLEIPFSHAEGRDLSGLMLKVKETRDKISDAYYG